MPSAYGVLKVALSGKCRLFSRRTECPKYSHKCGHVICCRRGECNFLPPIDTKNCVGPPTQQDKKDYFPHILMKYRGSAVYKVADDHNNPTYYVML